MTSAATQAGGKPSATAIRFPFTSVPLLLALAAAIGNAIGHTGTSTMPFQIGALIDDQGLSASNAGLFGFVQVAVFAASMVLIAPFVDRISARLLGLAGIGLVVLGSALIYATPWSMVSFLFTALMGVGFGFAFAATIAALSRGEKAEQLYAISNGMGLVFVFLVVTALPFAAVAFQPLGAFAGIAIFCLITAPLIWFLKVEGSAPASASAPVGVPGWSVLRAPGALGLIALWFMFSLGTGAVWAFSERMGRAADLAPEVIGLLLSLSIAFGIFGTLVAGMLGARIGPVLKIGGGLAVTGLGCAMMGLSSGVITFGVGVCLYWIGYMYLYSVLLGAAAAIDPGGRLGTFGGGAERMAYALGAWIGGVTVDHLGLVAVGLLGAGGCLIAFVLGLPGLLRRTR